MPLTATITEIASALKKSRVAINKRKKSQMWSPVNNKGADEFDIEQIGLKPEELNAVKNYLKNKNASKALDKAIATVEAPALTGNLPVKATENLPAIKTSTALQPLSTLKKWQVEAMEARMYFMRLIEHAESQRTGITKAIRDISRQAEEGVFPEGLVSVANKRCGKDTRKRALSTTSLMRWWSTWLKKGKKPEALAPKDVEKLSDQALAEWCENPVEPLPDNIPAWLPWFLAEYQTPSKHSRAEAHRRMKKRLPAGISCPSYYQMDRMVKRIPLVLLERGRMTGAELKALKGYVTRDASMFEPLTLCQIDGHSFKAYVAHPTTGAHFHPEVCGVICLTTKVLFGWSWGLAESSRTVSDAYRHCCTINEEKRWGGVPAMIEPDRGAGNMAKVNADDFTGRFARIGTTFLPPEQGGNPQGHGAIERSNQSIWIRAAKQLPTYTGKDMDRVAKKNIYTRLERDLKKARKDGKIGACTKTSDMLLAPEEFTEFLRQAAIEYNNTPHSALPKITAPPPGESDGTPIRRHMTPFESLAEFIAEGWQPTAPQAEILPYLFMPHTVITPKRCLFTLNGNKYYAPELENWHDRDMIAAYDIHDARKVFVLDQDERYVCTANWEGNRAYARPVTEVEQAMIQRENRRAKNLETKLDLVHAEARPALPPEYIELPPEVLEYEAREQEKAQLREENRQKYFNDANEIYDDIREREKLGLAKPYEIAWADDKDRSDQLGKRVGLYKEDPLCTGRFKEA